MTRRDRTGPRPGAWLLFPLTLTLAGCAGHEVAQPEGGEQATARRLTEITQRLGEIERRLQRLENQPPVEAPYGNREDVENQIGKLEAERTALLLRYTEQHPAIRDIDRKLRILREQSRLLEP